MGNCPACQNRSNGLKHVDSKRNNVIIREVNLVLRLIFLVVKKAINKIMISDPTNILGCPDGICLKLKLPGYSLPIIFNGLYSKILLVFLSEKVIYYF